jgi:DNA-binding transcriptional ArsR family regulator
MRRKRTPAKPPEPKYFSPRHQFKLYAAIRASIALPSGPKIAWEALADRFWEDDESIKCSYDDLARDIGLKRDQAKRHVKVLQRAGLLEIKPCFRDNHQLENEFFFVWRDPEEIRTGDLGIPRRAQGGLRQSRVYDTPSDASASGG